MSITMVLVAMVSIVAYLGLAIWGEGGVAAYFSHPALIAIAAVTVILTGASFFTNGNLSSGEREDRGNRWVLLAIGAIGILGGFLPAYCDRIGFWTFDGDAARWSGVVAFAAGGVLRLWPVFVLGNRFSGLVAIQPGHRLVTTGIFSHIRNPSYLGLLLTMFGWGLAFRSWVGIILMLLAAIAIVGRIRSEEAMLRSQFGAEYDAYCARTWRLIPGLY
jgi:protein-S-isoprenylcysteine O-methyltransferase Ste14